MSNSTFTLGLRTGQMLEQKRIIELLIELCVIRRDAFNELVAFNIDGTEVIYLPGLELNHDKEVGN